MAQPKKKRLKTAMAQKKAFQLIAEGKTIKEVASKVGRSRRMVYRWLAEVRLAMAS